MGRHKIPRSEQIRRALEEFPELTILPPAHLRKCPKCWLYIENGRCPFGEPKGQTLPDCVAVIEKWNKSALEMGIQERAWETDALKMLNAKRWQIEYELNGQVKMTFVVAVTTVDAAIAFQKSLPRAEVKRILEASDQK